MGTQKPIHRILCDQKNLEDKKMLYRKFLLSIIISSLFITFLFCSPHKEGNSKGTGA